MISEGTRYSERTLDLIAGAGRPICRSIAPAHIRPPKQRGAVLCRTASLRAMEGGKYKGNARTSIKQAHALLRSSVVLGCDNGTRRQENMETRRRPGVQASSDGAEGILTFEVGTLRLRSAETRARRRAPFACTRAIWGRLRTSYRRPSQEGGRPTHYGGGTMSGADSLRP